MEPTNIEPPVNPPGDTVSVAMATHNSSRFLREQLDSVLTQTLAPAEIVISDDGSTDDTLEILADYERRDSRITVLRDPPSGGNRINRNFEHAARRCSGTWLAFCDHDDIWLPHKLESLCRQGQDVSLVYGRSELVDETARSIGVTAKDYLDLPVYFTGAVPLYVFLDTNTVSGHATIVRRALVEAALPFPSLGMLFDHWLALVALARGGIRFVDEPVVLHRVHSTNSVHRARPRGRRQRPRQPARERYRAGIEARLEVLQRLESFRDGLHPADRDFLDEYLGHLRRAPARYFDLRYLVVGFAMRRRLYPRRTALRLLSECFGGRCYGA